MAGWTMQTDKRTGHDAVIFQSGEVNRCLAMRTGERCDLCLRLRERLPLVQIGDGGRSEDKQPHVQDRDDGRRTGSATAT